MYLKKCQLILCLLYYFEIYVNLLNLYLFHPIENLKTLFLFLEIIQKNKLFSKYINWKFV